MAESLAVKTGGYGGGSARGYQSHRRQWPKSSNEA